MIGFKIKKSVLKIALAGSLLICGMQTLQAENIRFYSSDRGLPPFYWQDHNRTIGIIPDILSGMSGYTFDFIPTPRKRVDPYFRKGRIDAAMLHPSYTQVDNLLDFVELGFKQKTTLFAHRDQKQTPSSLDRLENLSVCARDGYTYINMKKRWQSQSLRRENLRSDENVLRMLYRKRCDLAIGSSLSMKHQLQKHGFSNVFETNIIINQVPRYIAVSKNKTKFAAHLKKHLHALKASGRLDEIIQRYAPETNTP